jgi:hypothetical protein
MQFIYFISDVDYWLCITWIIHQQLQGSKLEEKLQMGVREQERLNSTGLENVGSSTSHKPIGFHGM